jgi:hypothetical protein
VTTAASHDEGGKEREGEEGDGCHDGFLPIPAVDKTSSFYMAVDSTCSF